jgi:ribulose-phosphate 3-epimerase
MPTHDPRETLRQHLGKDVPRLSVGLMTADWSQLGNELRVLEHAGIELIHIDVMDGVFCPMLTVGPAIVRSALRTPMFKDVHLMVDDPLAKVDDFVAAGADIITFHLEGAAQPHRVLQVLREARTISEPGRPIVRGVAINPSTSIDAVAPLLDEIDYLLVLSINPGWTGQTFMRSTERRLSDARALIETSGNQILLGVDGGVTRDNIDTVLRLGADIVVTGSAVFDGKSSPTDNVRFMLERAAATGRGVRLERPGCATRHSEPPQGRELRGDQ